MRKIFSLFTAILFAGSMMATDPAAAGTTLFSEDFSGYAKDAVPSGTVTTATGRVVYGDASVIYTAADGTSTTKIYNENIGGGTAPEILISKNNGSLTIAGIPSGGAKEITVSWTQNKQKLKVEASGTGYSGSKEEKPANVGTNSVDVTVADEAAETFTLIFTCTGSSNVRVDDILVVVKTAGEASQGGGETPSTIKTLYCKVAQDWWKENDAAVGVYAFKGEEKNAEFPGVRMTAVEGEADLWKADIDTAAYSSIIFTRVNASGDIANWGAQTEDLEIPADKDLYTITSATAQWIGEGHKVTGEWSVYGEEPVVEPAKFYITGDSALVVNAGLDKEQAWNPAAIKSEVVSYKLNLAAGDYMLKITLDGTWGEGKVLGYDAMTTKKDGLTRGEGQADDNICFTLTEAGDVSVHYDGEFFFLNGNFYVAPVEVHYYFKNNWGGEEWTWREITDEEGYYTLGPVAVGGEGVNFHTAMTDDAPFITWAEISAFDASYEPAVIGAGDTVLFFFDPEEVNTYTGANGLSAYITGKYVAPEEPVYSLENGYYLVGDKYDWNPAAERLFVANGEGGEYVLAGVTLAAEDSLKVVYVENDAITIWYPSGTDNNYVVDAAHAGVKDIYFRPDYQGGTDWYNSCIFIAPNSGTAIDKVAGEAKAVKILKNGMLIIEKNGVKYNVLGVRL